GAPRPVVGGAASAVLDPPSLHDALPISCPCQRAHDPRLLDLHRRWSERGVRFVSVDAEANSSLERDVREQKKRGYPFPILSDPRSEEHTSELQSRANLVCRLLLEKKNRR